jgi:hypothetical protein
MAQVNSEPGVSQTPPTVVVPAAVSEPAASDTKTKSAAKVVTYSQTEVGVTVNPKRS